MVIFEVRFTRWDRKAGRRTQSTPVALSADTFFQVVDRARDIMRGMNDANEDCEFGIASIVDTGLRGDDAVPGGKTIWSLTRDDG